MIIASRVMLAPIVVASEAAKSKRTRNAHATHATRWPWPQKDPLVPHKAETASHDTMYYNVTIVHVMTNLKRRSLSEGIIAMIPRPELQY